MYPGRPRRQASVCACLLALCPIAPAQQAGQYTATLVSGPVSTANAITPFGAIIGSATYSGGAVHATQWASGLAYDLGTLGGTNSAALAQSIDIVGWSETSSGDRHAFVGGGTGLSDLGTLGGTTSTATGMGGPAGEAVIVGFSTTASGQTHAFSSSMVTMTDLGTLGGPTSAANAVAGDGTIVGVSDVAGCAASPCTRHAVSWSNGVIKDLGVLAASVSTDSSEALGLYSTAPTGELVFGYAQVQGVNHPVVWGWHGTGATDLGALDAGGGMILAYQNGLFGQSTKLDGTQHATGWTYDNGAFTATDLAAQLATTSPLQPVLTKAYGQNNDGWVLATSSDSVYVLAPIAFSQSSLVFDKTLVGQTNSLPLKITYTGSALGASITPSIMFITITTTGDFQFDSQCGPFIKAGDSCSGDVLMKPSQAGPRTGTLVFTPQDPSDYPVSLPLSGVGGISATLSAASIITTAGTPDTLTWASVGATACTASGDGSADGWSGALAPSGSLSVSETTAGTYIYNLTCTAADQTATAQAVVTVSSNTGSGRGSGGGGFITMGELALLLCCLGIGMARRPVPA